MKSFIRQHTPRAVWVRLSRAKYSVLDSVDSVLGRDGEMTPPRSLRLFFAGDGDFGAIGKEFVSYFQRFCNLQADHRVLDMGCGTGRMAIPLTEYLSSRGSYEGVDVVPRGIKWCSAHITPRYPNFRFHLADIFSEAYNRTGRFRASDYRFPFDDNSFDFAFLTSVFTHLLPEGVERYLSELHRVLRPGGRCLITWFVLNRESEALLSQGKSSIDVPHLVGECRIGNLLVPEEAVAHPEFKILGYYRNAGFVVEPPVRYGSWCGRTTFLSFQDICITHKPELPRSE
jgi:SAM-dependent methyltransferase